MAPQVPGGRGVRFWAGRGDIANFYYVVGVGGYGAAEAGVWFRRRRRPRRNTLPGRGRRIFIADMYGGSIRRCHARESSGAFTICANSEIGTGVTDGIPYQIPDNVVPAGAASGMSPEIPIDSAVYRPLFIGTGARAMSPLTPMLVALNFTPFPQHATGILDSIGIKSADFPKLPPTRFWRRF